jgi:hypothetical protein
MGWCLKKCPNSADQKEARKTTKFPPLTVAGRNVFVNIRRVP